MFHILTYIAGLVTMMVILGVLEVVGNRKHRKQVDEIREELKKVCRYPRQKG